MKKCFVLLLLYLCSFFSTSLFASDRYIVVYKNGKQPPRAKVMAFPSVKAIDSFDSEIKADVIVASKVDINMVKTMPEVDYVEEDVLLRANDETWGLDRIDDRNGLDGSYEAPNDAEGIHAYVVDTGINTKHEEFEGRVGEGFSSVEDTNGPEDCHGHGTHVAGTVAGTKYGVAKKATLHSVRVLDCQGSGYTSGVIAGVEWVGNNHIKPAVANMSLGGGVSKTLDTAIQNAIDKGVSFVVAAGNDNADACNGSPARVPEAITVGATDSRDIRASFSSYGNCVDVFAPGVSILSAWIGGSSATNTISGTSMASPHVAGGVALYLKANPEAKPGDVDVWLAKTSSKNRVQNSRSRNDHLLYVGKLDEEDVDPNPEPDPGPNPKPDPNPGPYQLYIGDNGQSCIEVCSLMGAAYNQEGTMEATRHCKRTLYRFGYSYRRIKKNHTKNGCGMYDKATGWYSWWFNTGWRAREVSGESFDKEHGGFRRICACG